MKKIGILSMQRIENYGSFMQAYGLKKVIESLGYEVEFVDYHAEPCITDGKEKKSVVKDIKRCVMNSNIYLYAKDIYRSVRKRKKVSVDASFMERYQKEFLPLLGISAKKNYRAKVDTLVIGSDEVFNCLQQNKQVGYSKELFGYGNRAKKVITYAASFGNTTKERLDKYGKTGEIAACLQKVDAISVRDTNSGNVVRSLLGIEPIYHIDPVLIYDFSAHIKTETVKHTDYMIVYAYSGRISDEEAQVIRDFAKKQQKKLISISGYQKFCDEHLVLTPFEVLAYFQKADYILTDTFHGSIFSIINNKSFATIIRKTVGEAYGNEEKITDLLERLNLQNRILNHMGELEEKLLEPINYESTNARIVEERKRTQDYLKKNLK